MDIENHKLHPMEVYERELNDEQLYWVGLVQWLKWRWAWDGLRVLGFLLLLVRVVDAYGVNTWGAYGGDMPMWLALAPFLLLDGVALKVLVQSRYYPLFQGEDMSLKLYTVLAGFPCGTVFKILAIVEYDGDVNVQASAYWYDHSPTFSFASRRCGVVLLGRVDHACVAAVLNSQWSPPP